MIPEVEIVDGWPPNRDEIVAAFHPEPGTLFAWEGTIYVPGIGDREVPRYLIEHERVHFGQQELAGGAEAWWRRYIDDPGFRLEQEVEAYRAQWRSLRGRPKRERFTHLYLFSRQLAGPMYGELVTPSEARRLIEAAAA